LIDLRSDTATRPDDEMRRAMAAAEVGDDALGEDPTVNRLQEEGAAALGYEAALFLPSGTMGNQIALHLLARQGSEVVCDARSHVVHLENGAMAALSGLLPRTIATPKGQLDAAEVEALLAARAAYHARVGAIALENTHNLAGGTVYARPEVDALLAVARRHGLPIHLDGARIFNAAVALGTTAAALASGFDTAQFCLSKGLGAPVGSLLCASRELIAEARRVRKMLGGGMRQAGVIAAAGLVALRKGPGRLAQDHAHAALLARAVAELPGVVLDPAAVVTNIVVFRVTPALFGGAAPAEGLAAGFIARLRGLGVLASQVSGDEVRVVTHRDVSRADVEPALERLRQLAPC